MFRFHKFVSLTVTTVFVLLSSIAGVWAQNPTNPRDPTLPQSNTSQRDPVLSERHDLPQNPVMTSQAFDNQKESLYAQFVDSKRNPNPEKQKLAFAVGKEFLRRYGGDKDDRTKDVQNFVAEYERNVHGLLVFAEYSDKKYVKAFEIGRPFLKSETDNFFVLAVLSEAGYDSAIAGNATLNAETIDYTRRAIQLLEAGKVTKADPFKNFDLARGFLNYALAWFVQDQKPVEAAAAFRKAVESDTAYRTDPSVYHRLGVSILKGEFAQASAEYNEKYGNKPPSPEQTAMLNRIMHLAEQAIDAYARAVALSAKPEQQEARTKMLAQLTALYKNFHNNSDAGLNDLISTVLSKPLPQ